MQEGHAHLSYTAIPSGGKGSRRFGLAKVSPGHYSREPGNLGGALVPLGSNTIAYDRPPGYSPISDPDPWRDLILRGRASGRTRHPLLTKADWCYASRSDIFLKPVAPRRPFPKPLLVRLTHGDTVPCNTCTYSCPKHESGAPEPHRQLGHLPPRSRCIASP